LILYDLGFKKLPTYSADDFFEIIARCYETGSQSLPLINPLSNKEISLPITP